MAAEHPAGSATLTANAGTGSPTAANTGEPAEPARATARQPRRDATNTANRPAATAERTGTNKQTGAGDRHEADENTRTAHTSRPQRRATTGAERRAESTATKPAMTHPQARMRGGDAPHRTRTRRPGRAAPKREKNRKKERKRLPNGRGEHGCKGRRAGR